MRNKADTIFHGYVLGWGYIHKDLMDEEKRLVLSLLHIYLYSGIFPVHAWTSSVKV